MELFQALVTISKVLSRGPAWTRNYEKFTSTKCTNYQEKHYNISLCGAKLKPRIKFCLSLSIRWSGYLTGYKEWRRELYSLYPLLVKLSTNFQVCFKPILIFIIYFMNKTTVDCNIMMWCDDALTQNLLLWSGSASFSSKLTMDF